MKHGERGKMLNRFLATATVGVALVLVCSLLAGCSSNNSGRSVQVGNGVTIQVPSSAASFVPAATPVPGADGALLASVSLPGGGSGPSPFVSLATPVHLTSKGVFPQGGVTLSFHVDPASVPAGMTPFIATDVPSSGTWSPVATHYDASDGEVSAHAPHFSIWGVFSFIRSEVETLVKNAFDQLFGSIKVTDPPPICGDSTGLTSVMTPANGDLEVCTQNGAGNTAIIKVKSFLAFPIDIDYVTGMTVNVTPPGDLFTEIGGALNNASDGKSKGTVIAAGSEADISFPLAPGNTARVISNLDTLAYLTGVIESGVNVLTLMENKLGKHPQAVLDAISQGKCADEAGQLAYITSPISLSALDQLSQTAIDCASTVVNLGTGGTIDAIIGTVDGLIENVLQSAFGAAILAVGGPNGTNTAITMSRAAVTAAPIQPTAPTGAIPQSIDQGKQLNSISCASSAFCAAVDSDGNVLIYDGSSWSTPRLIDQGNQLNSISCASSAFCAAVDSDGNVLIYDGSSWSSPQSIDQGNQLNSISCASSAFCAAVDSDGNALTFVGSSWQVSMTSDDLLESVSCPTVTYCAAVGYDDPGGNVFTYDGASWSGPDLIDPGYKLHSVSCVSPSFCAVGAAVRVITYDGSTWSAPDSIDQSNNQSSQSGFGLPSMSCFSNTFCATVDGNGNAFTFDGTAWSSPQSVDSGNQLNSISCPSATWCMAVNSLGDAITVRSP
jgi:hypothetical protein